MNDASLSSDHLRNRPDGAPLDHIGYSRGNYTAELERTDLSIKIIDLRMEETEQEIVRLRKQLADDRRELADLVLVKRAAQRGLAELDGMAP